MELWEIQNGRSEAMLLLDDGKLPEAKDALDRLIGSVSADAPPQLRFALANCLTDRATILRFTNEWDDALKDLSVAQSYAAGMLPLMRRPLLTNIHLLRAKLLATAGSQVFDLDGAQREVDALRGVGANGWMVDELESHVAFQRRDWETALRMALEAIDGLRADSWPRGVAACQCRAGKALLELGRLDDAAAQLAPSLEFFEWRGPNDLLSDTRLALARLASRRGNHDTAWTLATQALEEMESRLRRFRDVREQQLFVFDKLPFYDHAFDIALATPAETGVLRAWSVAERAKSFYLAQLLANAQVPLFEGVDPESIRELERAEAEMDDCERRLEGLSSTDAAGATALEARRTELSRLRGEKLRRLMQQNPKWLAVREPPPFDASAFLRRVASTWIPISYFWRDGDTGSMLHIFAAGDGGRPVHEATSWTRSDLAALEYAGDPLSGDIDMDKPLFPSTMAERVFPSSVRTRWSVDTRLLISPHGVLRGLPLHALEVDGMSIAEQWPVQYTPGLGLTVAAADTEARSALLIGCVENGFGDDPLPDVETEIHDLSAIWTSASSDAVAKLVAKDGTLADVGCPPSTWARFEILHFACHGVFPPDQPFDASLRIGAEAVRASELFGVKLNARMVTLSACALGRQARQWGDRRLVGDEWVGLYLPLFYAGARSLVASLWDAESWTATRFMKALHASVAAGADPAVAFRAAVHAVRTEPALFWANWCLVGFPQLDVE